MGWELGTNLTPKLMLAVRVIFACGLLPGCNRLLPTYSIRLRRNEAQL